MRQSWFFWGILAALAGVQAAQAEEVFCDPIRDLSGGVCRQNLRSTAAAVSGEEEESQLAVPNSKVLDLRACARINCDKLDFTLDLKHLSLDAATPNDPTKATRVDVLELGVLSPGLTAAGQNGYRVLAMSVLHEQNDDAYMVDFSWREQQGPWLPVSSNVSPPAELNAALGLLRPNETYLTLRIAPVDGDWSDLEVTISALDGATRLNRDVPLTPLNDTGFRIPDAAENEGRTQPWLLRSGIIDGDLKRVGMTTEFDYQDYWIRTIQSMQPPGTTVPTEPPPGQPTLPPPDSFD